MFINWEDSIICIKMSHLLILIYRFNGISIKLLAGLLIEIDVLILTLYLNAKNLNSQTNFGKKRTMLEDLYYLISRLAIKLK